MELVAVIEIQDEDDVEAQLGLLRAKGIECWCRRTDLAMGGWTGWTCTGGPVEVLVREEDLKAARELLLAPQPSA